MVPRNDELRMGQGGKKLSSCLKLTLSRPLGEIAGDDQQSWLGGT
jgi:hypothetical protein